jgi:glycerophosphoryl diester phosphodiesterase
VSRGHVFESARPLVFAHRGGARLAPENTLVAFATGMSHGADGFECDVHLSRDGVPVVIHDASLDRTTNASGPVVARTAQELAEVDAGYHFGEQRGHPFRGAGHGVPTLERVLASWGDARAIVELKGTSVELARAVVDVVRRVGAVERVCVGAFSAVTIRQVRALEPGLATSASQPEVRWTLHRSWVHWPFMPARPYQSFQVPERAGRLRVVSPRFVRQAHREGQTVHVWVVNEPADMSRLLDWGVDGLISDRPDLAVAVRDAWYEAHASR